MAKFALYVPLHAKPGKEKDVEDFLRSAVPLVNAEPGTISWFAIQEGPSRFAIFDTFDDEAGREAHLNGKVAAALMEKAKGGDLFEKTPEIHKLGVSIRAQSKPSADGGIDLGWLRLIEEAGEIVHGSPFLFSVPIDPAAPVRWFPASTPDRGTRRRADVLGGLHHQYCRI
jgi:quinol monooxygenase YgiN